MGKSTSAQIGDIQHLPNSRKNLAQFFDILWMEAFTTWANTTVVNLPLLKSSLYIMMLVHCFKQLPELVTLLEGNIIEHCIIGETFFFVSSRHFRCFLYQWKKFVVYWYWTGYFSIMSKLNRLYNAEKNTLLSNASEMGG